jgi:hypothetical protein
MMNIEQALTKIGGPIRGLSSVLESLMTGEVAPVAGDKRITESLRAISRIGLLL